MSEFNKLSFYTAKPLKIGGFLVGYVKQISDVDLLCLIGVLPQKFEKKLHKAQKAGVGIDEIVSLNTVAIYFRMHKLNGLELAMEFCKYEHSKLYKCLRGWAV